MDWMNEAVSNSNQPWQSYRPRFLALKGPDLLLFETPPVCISYVLFYLRLLKPPIYHKDYVESNRSCRCFQYNIGDWSRCALTFKVYQTMFRVMRESENVDERQHCFLAQSPGKPPRYLSVETRQELLRVEAAWHTAICSAVTHLKVRRDARAFLRSIFDVAVLLSRLSLFVAEQNLPGNFQQQKRGSDVRVDSRFYVIV